MLLWEHRGWILRMTSLYKGQTVCRMQAIRHENLSGFLQNSDRKPSRLPFRLKELWTFACFPVSQHSGFYFPPSANKDRAVNIIEIKDFIILWTYSQWWQDLVIIPPFSPERETCCILPLIVFRMLILCKKRTFHFIPAICKYCTVSSRRVAVFNVTWPI